MKCQKSTLSIVESEQPSSSPHQASDFGTFEELSAGLVLFHPQASSEGPRRSTSSHAWNTFGINSGCVQNGKL
eukprot:5105747-Amphidinium_carterae.1